MFFFATNNSIVFFYNWLLYNFPEISNDIGIFTSINENKQSALEKQYILTTSKSAGAAVDIPGLMVCVNMAEPTKSPPQNKQRFGRTRAYNSFYIDVVDVSLKVISNYYKASYAMFEKYSIDMKDVVFTQSQLENTAYNAMYKHYKESGCIPFVGLV
jgi:superfamily II DNA or RNA helicase